LNDPRSTPPGERVAAERPNARPGDEAAARRDEILVARALDGDLAAFNQLVEAYQDLCHSLVVRLVPDPDQAADAVQEAFFSAYRNLRSYRGPSFRGWLTRIAVNAAGLALSGARGRVLAAPGRAGDRSRDHDRRRGAWPRPGRRARRDRQ
jgi:DNA-directed RNA polymerase specialized sigma24 family protein